MLTNPRLDRSSQRCLSETADKAVTFVSLAAQFPKVIGEAFNQAKKHLMVGASHGFSPVIRDSRMAHIGLELRSSRYGHYLGTIKRQDFRRFLGILREQCISLSQDVEYMVHRLPKRWKKKASRKLRDLQRAVAYWKKRALRVQPVLEIVTPEGSFNSKGPSTTGGPVKGLTRRGRVTTRHANLPKREARRPGRGGRGNLYPLPARHNIDQWPDAHIVDLDDRPSAVIDDIMQNLHNRWGRIWPPRDDS